jgi:hypothetical protein
MSESYAVGWTVHKHSGVLFLQFVQGFKSLVPLLGTVNVGRGASTTNSDVLGSQGRFQTETLTE